VSEVQALVGLEQALVNLQLARGTILDDVGVVYEPAAEEEPIGFFGSLTEGLPW